jgi:phosphoenolpyruvate phosphomutase
MKSKLLRDLLKKKSHLVLGGAHDALSAKLIEETGYDAVWASSFGISAATRMLPDANVLTMTEMLEAVKGMAAAVNIPLIADCDNGYGNVHNVMRMVREYEKAGIAGVSIEDNPFPKKCSLYPGERQILVDIGEMAGRIKAAKSTQVSKDFFVIARTEALIADMGMEEALRRALAYEEAGADAILIHSRKSTPDEIITFCARWKKVGRIPLVAVPTKYPEITSKELSKLGIKIAIFANQALRASVKAMREVLTDMRKADKPGAAIPNIVPLDEVFRMVGQPVMEENEAKFVKGFKKKPAAIIVAAGFEQNFWPLNQDRPKAMLEIKGKSILERQVEVLRGAGIERIVVVGGYQGDKIQIPGVTVLQNKAYKTTGMLKSLFCAESAMSDGFVFCYGDVLFEDHVIEKLLKAKSDFNLVVDQMPTPNQKNGSRKSERDWAHIEDHQVTAIGHHLTSKQANGEFAGLASFSKHAIPAVRNAYAAALKKKSGRYQNAAAADRAQFTDFAQDLIGRGQKAHAVTIRSGWTDIHSFADYQKAWASIS